MVAHPPPQNAVFLVCSISAFDHLVLTASAEYESIRVLQPAVAPRGPFGCVKALVTKGVKPLLKSNCGATPNHKHVAQPAETGTS